MLRYKIASKLIEPRLAVKKGQTGSFYYDTDKKALIIGNYPDLNEYGFMRHLGYEHGYGYDNAGKYRYALWHLLHEIGHFHIEDEYGDNREERKYVKEFGKYMLSNRAIQDELYNRGVEWAATEWAIKWIKKHKIKAKVLSLLLK